MSDSDFSPAIRAADLSPGRPVLARLERGRALIVRRADGSIAAFSPLCPHQLGDLSMGDCRGDAIECPVHGYVFDLRTGACVYPREAHALRFFDVRVEEGWVHVRVPRPKWMED